MEILGQLNWFPKSLRLAIFGTKDSLTRFGAEANPKSEYNKTEENQPKGKHSNYT